jgi:serine/threonine protein phosphatase PrpC
MDFRFVIRRKSKSPPDRVFSRGGPDNGKVGIVYAGLSDKGNHRELNEDAFGVYPDDPLAYSSTKGQLFIVADGMGGHLSGKEASEIAIQTIRTEYFKNTSMGNSECLVQAFHLANTHIFKESEKRDRSQIMGTTCSALVLAGNMAQIAHLGDSRIYRVRGEHIDQVTEDHTEATDLIRAGILSEDDAPHYPRRSAINRALGVEAEVDIEIHKDIPLQEPDCFVLCTDGLAAVSDHEIRGVVQNGSPQDACLRLIKISRRLGSRDNATVIVLKFMRGIT